MKLIEILKEIKKERLLECVVAGVRLGDGIVLAKNRDRGYDAKMEIVHEVVDNVEMVYWHDIDTDWSEGMNEFGIGIVNSSLMVGDDEKETDKVEKKREENEEEYLKHNAEIAKNWRDNNKEHVKY